jgi:hypothetical protein
MNKYSEYLDFVEGQFEKCFSKKGYVQEIPVCITSKVDPTVDFIGSKISPMKKYILNESIGKNGRFMIQNCLRTKVLKHLKTVEPTMFGSCFRCMGVLTEPKIEHVVFDTFDYLVNYLNIPFKDIRIRINTQDEDLVKSIENVDKNIAKEIDSHNANYRHKYGLDKEGITGRDFNIAIRKRNTEKFINVGTIVIMESDRKKYAIDMGLGNITFSMCKHGADYAISSSRMADVMDIDTIEKTKLADAITVVSTLQYEDVKNKFPGTSNIRWRFNQYNSVISFWKDKLGVNNDQISMYMEKYIGLEFKNNNYRSEITWEK